MPLAKIKGKVCSGPKNLHIEMGSDDYMIKPFGLSISLQSYAVRSKESGVIDINPWLSAPMSVPVSGTPVGASPPIQWSPCPNRKKFKLASFRGFYH